MEGGAGNDTYVLNDAGDQVIELSGNGTDKIWVPFSYSLETLPYVENLSGFGTGNFTLTGNDLDNVISGGDGNDTLRGGKGNDRLDGYNGTADAAVFSGPLSDYTVSYDATTATYTVADKVGGRDGTDTVRNTEFFTFSDGQRPASAITADVSPPLIVGFAPADDARDVAVDSNFVFTFSESVQRGSGNIVLRDANNQVIETFNAATSSAISVVGTVLTINPTRDLAAGVGYRLEFDAGSIRDLAGNWLAAHTGYNFSTRVGDDFGSTTATNGRLAVGQSINGAIEVGGDTDWVAITLNAGQSYRFTLDGGTLADPGLTLYSASGIRITSDDDSGPGLNALLTYRPTTTGTFFLGASGYSAQSGTYTLAAALAVTDDFSATTATTGRVTVGGAAVPGNIETVDDMDWFAVSLTAGQSYRFNLNANGLPDPLFAIFSATGDLLAADDDSGGGLNSQILFTAPTSGTYYLAAMDVGSGLGRYTVSAVSQVIDDFAATTATTGRLAVGGSVSGQVETSGDKDWFAISLSAGQTYQFKLDGQSLSDAALTLYSGAGLQLATDDNSAGNLDALITFKATSTGTYYLGAGGAASQTGGYVLSASAVASDDYAGGTSTLGRVAVGGSATGSIEAPSDTDWFAVTLAAGQGYRFQLDGAGLTDPVLTLFASNGSLLLRDDDSGEGSNALINFTAPSAGTYYLGASATGALTGGYRLSVSAAANDDFAGTTVTGGRVTVGGSASGVIETVNDSDWFAVSLTAGQRYEFRLNGTGQNDPRLTLMSAQGQQLATDDDGGGGLNALLSYTAAATGTYYLDAQMGSGSTGAYTLAAASSAGPDDGSFSIRLQYTGDPRYKTYFEQAAQRWSQVIVGDLPGVNTAEYGMIDDLLITVGVRFIDGSPALGDGNDGSGSRGNILAQASATRFRNAGDGGLPYLGNMVIDSADIIGMEGSNTLLSVIMHEMGHVLGFYDQMFISKGLMRGFEYVGANGLAVYRELTNNLGVSSVPMETSGGAGTAGSHWSETVFQTELMTGYAQASPPMPLSRLTVGAMEDLGYRVNYAAADPYNLPARGGLAGPSDVAAVELVGSLLLDARADQPVGLSPFIDLP
jgi:hypothetical protein